MPETEILQSKGQYIDGTWFLHQAPHLESINPASGSIIWQGTEALEADISTAFQAADQALAPWFALGFEQRAGYAQKFAQLVETRGDALAQLISLETGKPLWEAQTEVKAVIGKIALSIQAYQERTGHKEFSVPEASAHLRFKPQGVVVVLGAFNFPAHLSNGHIIPALLAGNTILYKPSEYTPAVAEFIMECWHDTGIPAGVINCLQGGASCGRLLLAQNIQGVYFTGSYATGLRIHQYFSQRPEVILALEMGGNNPLVIEEVSDLKAAIYHTLLSTLLTAGQRCTCARRLIIPNSKQGEVYLQHLIEACKSIKIGSFDSQPQPFMGSVISSTHALNHLQAQQELIQKGGKLLLKMELLEANTGFLSPGILDMSSVTNPPDQEIFAPFIQVYRYDHFDEALKLANQTKYGLSAALFSTNKESYEQFYQTIRAGLINWNRPTTGAASNLPFGGVGFSGNHRPSAYFAADYCAYPVSSLQNPILEMPAKPLPGIKE